MMTVTKLFFRRVISDWKYQYEIWKTAVDWIVALYIVIPAFATFVYYYLSWWTKAPGVLDYLPLNALLGFFLIFTWSGTIRIFLEAGDQLFLLQHKAWISKIFKYSLGYSIFYNLVETIGLITILAPFLVIHYGFSLVEVFSVVFLIFVTKNFLGLAKQLLELRFKGWSQRIVKSVVFVITGVYLRESVDFLMSSTGLFYLSVLISLIILGLLLSKRLSVKGTFFEDVTREQVARLRLAKYMLIAKGTYMKTPRITRKRPRLFRSSNLIFKKRNPVNGLVEMCIKAVLRNEEDFGFLLTLVGGHLLAIMAFPGNLKWLPWILFSFIITNYVGNTCLKVFNDPFVCFFPWLPESKITATRKAIYLMALPGQLLLALVVALLTGSFIVALWMVPIGIVIGILTAMRVSLKS